MDIFNTLIIDESELEVAFGPSAQGEMVQIGGWGDTEWRLLLAIANGGCSELELLDHVGGSPDALRSGVRRIRKRFLSRKGIPRKYANALIPPKRRNKPYALGAPVTIRRTPEPLAGHGPTEPHARVTAIHAITRAVIKRFGDAGLQQVILLLPDDVRRDTVDVSYAEPGRWIPVRYVQSWMKAVWEGPAALRLSIFRRFIRIMAEYRLMPFSLDYVRDGHDLARHVRQLWSSCYSSGEIEAESSPKNDWFEIRLRNHPYCDTEQARRIHAMCWVALAEAWGATSCSLDLCELDTSSRALRNRVRAKWGSKKQARPRPAV